VSDWVARPYDPSDQGFVVYSWLKSHGRSYYARNRRAQFGERSYWDSHRPIVMQLLEHVSITVLHVPDEPAVILAWAATEGADVLHYALCKRSVHDAGLAAAAFGALLGDRLGRAQLVTHEQMDLKDERRIVPPETWVPAPYQLAERAA
jgi:hypothetical protein